MSATVNSTEIVAAPALVPMSAADAREAMERWQAFTAAMLVETDWQTIPSGKFVKRSGWRKIATGYTLSCEILEDEVIERDEHGEPKRARAKARVIHRETGRSWEGTGRCSTTEARFRRGDAKAEHDVTATAVTRAINRATADLVGFGQVSAEEVDGGVAVAAETTPPLTDAAIGTVAAAFQEAWPNLDAHRFMRMLRKRLGGEVPEPVGTALLAWVWYATEYTGATGNARETGSEAPQTSSEA
jgi:hypothetical protein